MYHIDRHKRSTMLISRLTSLLFLVHFTLLLVVAQDGTVPQLADSPTGTYSESTPFVPKERKERKSKKEKAAKQGKAPKPDKQPPADSNGPAIPPSAIPESAALAVPVAVYDAKSNPVRGLTKDDFEIHLDDQRQEIVGFKADDEPLFVLFLIDVSPSATFDIKDIQKFFIDSLDRFRPEDKIAVISFDDRVKLGQDFTTDRAAIIKAINQMEFGDGTSLYEAIGIVSRMGLDYLDQPVSVVLYSDGVDTTSTRMDSGRSLLAAQQSNMTFYSLYVDTFAHMKGKVVRPGVTMDEVLRSIMSGRGQGKVFVSLGDDDKEVYEFGRAYLADLANATGGREIEFPTKKAPDIDLALEIRRRYTLHIKVDNPTRTGRSHHIKIRVNKPNLSVVPKRTFVMGE